MGKQVSNRFMCSFFTFFFFMKIFFSQMSVSRQEMEI